MQSILCTNVLVVFLCRLLRIFSAALRIQTMKSTELVLRCLAERDGNVWVASCLDLSLAAQGDSLDEVKKKLEQMIFEYVLDATVGEDREHADVLLNRKAPLASWIKYYFVLAQRKIGMLKDASRHLFTEALPLGPCNHGHA